MLDAISSGARATTSSATGDEMLPGDPHDIRFPTPVLPLPLPARCAPGYFGEIAAAIEGGLTLAVYADQYRKQPVQTGRQQVLAALLRSPRAESSLGAFRSTLERLVSGCDISGGLDAAS